MSRYCNKLAKERKKNHAYDAAIDVLFSSYSFFFVNLYSKGSFAQKDEGCNSTGSCWPDTTKLWQSKLMNSNH
jgi:hypothetical protein